jgi:TonB-linked SusC/RagA family outer membrane protein
MRYRSILSALILLFLGIVGSASAQTRIITGKVTDSLTNDVVTSGQVAVVGSTVGSTIKDDGTFTIAVPTRDVTLSIRSIGFKRKDVAVPASQNAVTASLARDYFQLEAIVVTGQATGVERKNLANSVASVQGADLVKAPTGSVENALQGKMAGADINQNNGAPGGGNIIRMRGVTSIIGSFQPLYVVDGVVVSNADIGRGTNLLTRAYTSQGVVPTTDNQDNSVNRIADLNPNDIENVEVLKGAAASAIYGSRASNGVIMITTKRGRTGAPQFSITQRFGASKISNTYGTRCFTSAAEAAGAFGGTAGAQYTAAGGACHDFEQELYGRAAPAYETSGSVSGGSDNSKYFASLLVKHDGGIMPRTFADKHNLRLNLDQNIGSRVQFSLGGDIIHTADDRGLSNNENNGSPPQAALSSMPSFIDYRGVCPDGSIVSNPGKPCAGAVYPTTQPYAFSNPFQTVALLVNRESVWRSIATGRLNWDILTSATNTLRATVVGGGDIFTQKNQVFAPPDMEFEQLRGTPGTSATGFGQSQSFNTNTNLVYTYKTANGTSATTQAGVQYGTADLDRSNNFANNLVGGQFDIQSGTIISVQQYRERVRELGFFGQEEFLTLNERLLLTAGLRADKSSNNSDATKFHYYPKGSISYRVPVSGAISELKLRAAVGESGNQPAYGQKFTELRPGNVAGLAISSIGTIYAAPDLRPEIQTEYEGGVDATLFKGRANLEATVYQKSIKDLLLTKTLTPTAGFAQYTYNGPAIRNRGLELGLSVLPVQSPSFQWNSRVTFFMNRCRVTSGLPNAFQPISFFNFAQFGTTQLQNDSSCTQVYANDTIGRLPGDASLGLGPTGTVVSRKIGENAPDFRAGLSNEFTYKKVKFYFLLDRQKGGLITNFSRYTYDADLVSTDQVTAKSGIVSGNDRLNSNAALGSATWDASYVKLREASISYELPTSAVKRLWSGARYVRLNVTGRNLITWSSYNKVGYDPEVQQVARSLAAEMTWELWAYPASRSFYFTVDLGF